MIHIYLVVFILGFHKKTVSRVCLYDPIGNEDLLGLNVSMEEVI
jgi:hypothetical protein